MYGTTYVCRSIHDVMRWVETMVTNEYIRNIKKGVLKPFNKKLFQKSFHDYIIRNEKNMGIYRHKPFKMEIRLFLQ